MTMPYDPVCVRPRKRNGKRCEYVRIADSSTHTPGVYVKYTIDDDADIGGCRGTFLGPLRRYVSMFR